MKTFFFGGVLNNGHAANTQKNNEKCRGAAGNGGVGGVKWNALNVETRRHVYTDGVVCEMQAAMHIRKKRAESAIHHIAQRRESAANVTLGNAAPNIIAR